MCDLRDARLPQQSQKWLGSRSRRCNGGNAEVIRCHWRAAGTCVGGAALCWRSQVLCGDLRLLKCLSCWRSARWCLSALPLLVGLFLDVSHGFLSSLADRGLARLVLVCLVFISFFKDGGAEEQNVEKEVDVLGWSSEFCCLLLC